MTELKGKTSSGMRYSVIENNGAKTMQFKAHNGVGPVTIPLTKDAPLNAIASSLSANGCVADHLRKYINT